MTTIKKRIQERTHVEYQAIQTKISKIGRGAITVSEEFVLFENNSLFMQTIDSK